MVFSSHAFLFWFLPVFLAGYFALPRHARNPWLTGMSYLFFGWFRPQYTVLMLVSTAIDYLCARGMGERGGQVSASRRRLLLWCSLAANLGLLGYFKYANLVVESLSEVSQSLGGQPIAWDKVVLPIGISFFTFQSMSYTIDVHAGRVQPTRSFLDLMCYVAMFPQLVAGPIVRYRTIAEQLVERAHTLPMFSTGVLLFEFGFAKKVLLADQAAVLADRAFATAAPGLLAAWTGAVGYAAQIYFDFSGYSDMAVGLGLMLGFTFPRNFDSPYRARSITEFWRRWHISLSTWLRDYLYIPLGGSRHGTVRTGFALMTTMMLGGLWHGAAWTFLLWGGYQGLLLVVERARGRRALYAAAPPALQVAATFVLVLVGWVIFRASSMAELGRMLRGMVGGYGLGSWPEPELYAWRCYGSLGCGLLVAFTCPQAMALARRFHLLAVVLGAVLFVLALAQLFATGFSPFIYYQF